MQGEKKQTVALRYRRSDADVPILVPSGDRHPDAYATFLPPPQFGARFGVRVLGPGDFHDMALRTLSKAARRRLRELIALRQGIAEQEHPSYWLRRFTTFTPREEKVQKKVEAAIVRDVEKTGRPSSRTARLMELAELKGDPLSFLSRAITGKLSKARLVLWWKGQPLPRGAEIVQQLAHFMYWRNREQFVAAIFCPDLETAFYVYALFQVTGRGFGICLECGEVFQKLRPDSHYCCFSHGEAFRLRRWRAAQREKEAREKK